MSRSTLTTALVLGTLCTLAGPTPLRAEEDVHVPRPGAPGIGDPYFPGLGNGGYDVQHYDLVLDVTMPEGSVVARATLSVRALHALSEFHLDFHGLTVEEVLVDGQVASHRREPGELIVTPPAPLAADALFEVVVRYTGTPDTVPDPSHPGRGVGWQNTDSGVYVLSECTGAAGWFPCNDHPRDKASVALTVTAPKPYVVAANGILHAEEDFGDRVRSSWRARDPMAPYLVTVNIAEFDVELAEGPRGMPIRTYYPKGASERELEPFRRQGEILEFLEFCFGPYPFDSIGAVISYEMLGGALETQTMPVYSRFMNDAVVAHEIAHQWFGDSVSTHLWQDMWLNEGFATYAALLWTEFAHGPDAMDRELRSHYGQLRSAAVVPPPDPGVEGLFGASSYVRGSWVLHALRREIGDEVFFELLQTWCTRKAGGTAHTEEFTEMAEEVSGRELDDFFERYLFAPVIPEEPEYES